MKRPKLQQIKLKCGIEVVVNWNSKKKCECGEEIYFAVTKNNKTMPICLVGLAEWDTHFANCPLARKFRKKKQGVVSKAKYVSNMKRLTKIAKEKLK